MGHPLSEGFLVAGSVDAVTLGVTEPEVSDEGELLGAFNAFHYRGSMGSESFDY